MIYFSYAKLFHYNSLLSCFPNSQAIYEVDAFISYFYCLILH